MESIQEITESNQTTMESIQEITESIQETIIIKKCTHHDKKCSHFKFICCNNEIDNCTRCHIERKSCIKPQIISIVCDECQTEQMPSKKCINCNINFGKNYCNKCNIWTAQDITHCDECDSCRAGLPETLKHCHTCSICYSLNNFECHTCNPLIKKFKKEDCSICLQPLFNTYKYLPLSLKCNHLIHNKCLYQYLSSGNYKCPLCRKSIIDMSKKWNELKNKIKSNPIEYIFKVDMIVPTSHGILRITDIVNKNLIFESKHYQMKNTILNLFREYKISNANTDYNIRGELIDIKTTKPTIGTFSAKSILTEYLKRKIICVDCDKKSIGEFHFIGIECKFCNSFNTVKE